MHPSFVDVENELSEVGREVERLAVKLGSPDLKAFAPQSQGEWEATLVCASATEKVYTGCERVMARIASEVDGVPLVRSDGWHMAVLRRMAHPFPGVRGPVISAQCHAVLDRLRSFRHRERNSYGLSLDFDIVVVRASEAVAGFRLFQQEVRVFFDQGLA